MRCSSCGREIPDGSSFCLHCGEFMAAPATVPDGNSETTYYSDSLVQVTNTRVVLGGTTYAMASITSVAMEERPAKRATGVVVAIIGLAMTFACSNVWGGNIGGWILVGPALLVVGILMAAIPKTLYAVRIGSASGEVSAFAARDQKYIQKIVGAIHQAIIERG